MNDRSNRLAWFDYIGSWLGVSVICAALTTPILWGVSKDIHQLHERISALERNVQSLVVLDTNGTLRAETPEDVRQALIALQRNAAIDAIPDAVLMENPDYQDSIDVVTLMSANPTERSSRWPTIQRQHLKTEWWCRGCGCTNKLQVHHKLPFHVDAAHELDDANLITLCMWSNRCHFVKGHLGNWKGYNTNIVHDAHVPAPRIR